MVVGAATTREQQVSDAVERLGTATLAALTLGISRVTVDVTLAHYHQKVCAPRITELEVRIAELESECRRLRDLPLRFVALDHRRVADGGRTKRQQMRQARSA
jgi:hypothetical protein